MNFDRLLEIATDVSRITRERRLVCYVFGRMLSLKVDTTMTGNGDHCAAMKTILPPLSPFASDR
jgi:hypothetical protein